MDLGLSLQVGKYDVQKLLGRGATGTVYLARDTFSGGEVALKTIEPEVFRDPEFGTVHRSQFLNEASLAGKLKHPHIVGILDAVVGEDSGYIAMELVTGGDLSAHTVPDRLLPIADVLQIGFKCCGALDYAFREGIVHRDIKPANIMIARGTDVKIADFGAAYLRKSQAVQTAIMGSPYYLSPEQIAGRELTHHSDMYALGVVLYELLTGQHPLRAENLQALLKKIVELEPLPPSEVRKDLPKVLDAVILRALKKKPEARYPAWSDFARELSKAARLVLPAEAIPDTEKYMALKSVEMLSNLADAEIWELANAGRWARVDKGRIIVREQDKGRSFFFLAEGEVKVTRAGRLLNVVTRSECFGEMAYIWGGELPRHASVESMTRLLLAEFEPEALARMSVGAQLQLTRALVRNLVDRLVLANTRVTAAR
ncbi:MAG: serine/threonine-protein kinase [Betaproteobacteria bacterium]|nr:serine/threonine-protein kinase [Betaproteobacteria bacterium]MDH5350780.1 serine/threonine-protein kinase [Betaproteobacteria bacterium]